MYFNKEKQWAERSIPTATTNKVIPDRRPSYLSFFEGGNFYTAIFNNGNPHDQWFKNFVPIQPFIQKGDALPEQYCTYEEGYEHTWDFMWKDYLNKVCTCGEPQRIVCGGTLICSGPVK